MPRPWHTGHGANRQDSRMETQRRRTNRTDGRARVRAFKRAAVAWRAGRPHQAWEILATSGFGDHWKEFQRQALSQARARYLRLIDR